MTSLTRLLVGFIIPGERGKEMNTSFIVIISIVTVIALWYRPDLALPLGLLATVAIYVIYVQQRKGQK